MWNPRYNRLQYNRSADIFSLGYQGMLDVVWKFLFIVHSLTHRTVSDLWLNWLIDCLIAWLKIWLIDWLIDWVIDLLIDGLIRQGVILVGKCHMLLGLSFQLYVNYLYVCFRRCRIHFHLIFMYLDSTKSLKHWRLVLTVN